VAAEAQAEGLLADGTAAARNNCVIC